MQGPASKGPEKVEKQINFVRVGTILKHQRCEQGFCLLQTFFRQNMTRFKTVYSQCCEPCYVLLRADV